MAENTLANTYTAKLENLLVDQFSARGGSLREKTASIADQLPVDLRDFLIQISDRADRLGQSPQSDESTREFVFQCGQAFERLEAWRQAQVSEELSVLQPDGTAPLAEFEQPELDAIGRLMAARDRFVKAVADFTLKFLLVAGALLLVGLLLGLI